MADTLVLCYHAVSESWPADLSLRPRDLRRQLSHLLDRGYRGVTFLEAVQGPAEGRRVAVTFDDGYRSVLELAAPILADLGLPGTLFLPTDWIGRDEPMTWPGIDHWLQGPHRHELLPISWDDARALARTGWELGSHTCSHPRLTTLGDEELQDELQESRRVCEERLGAPCPTIAYPYGDVDARVMAAAAAAGYEAGAALPSAWHPEAPLEWPRAGVWHSDDLRRFRLKTAAPVRRLRTLLGR